MDRPATIPVLGRLRTGAAGMPTAVLVVALAAGYWLDAGVAFGQFVGVPQKRIPPTSPTISTLSKRDPNAQMLVRADEIHYDYTNERVSAVGNVQIHYGGAALNADRVVYDKRNKRLSAEGNVRLVEADGKSIFSNYVELDENFRDGFIDSLQLDMPDKTRLAATRAERSAGNITVFQNGVYTACEPCKEDPGKPPRWQIKAARIIHDQSEKMIYYEDARLEMFGWPIAYLPYFSSPDPTVTRKSGFLMPTASYKASVYGFGVTTPYYWALSPHYDLTLSPTFTTRQGVLMTAEWRQRLINGSYSILASGIFQADKDAFNTGATGFNSGNRDFRGMLQTRGEFNINEKWLVGWNGWLITDKPFLEHYSVVPTRPELISQAYLVGRGKNSYFDARVIHYLGLSSSDVQGEIPIIHPVIDYFTTLGFPVFGGEVSHRMNVTSLSRSQADFDPITQTALVNGWCQPSADPAINAFKNPMNCLLRGVPGAYTRLSSQTQWRRSVVDGMGQVWTPFASVQADIGALSASAQPGVANFIPTGDDTLARAMPAVGVEYRYPLVSIHPWGTQTIEPIAQVIARPNETRIGRFPNEDAQSLVFSDANLFALDKFSGWDRVEGGGRANVGVQYSLHFHSGGYVNVLLGQSYHLFGKNSYAVPDTANTGLDSGLETRRSDYVARLTFQPASAYTFSSRFRLDEESFAVRTFELEGKLSYERWTGSVIYGNYDAQPDRGLLNRRQGVYGAGSLKLTHNWSVNGGLLYDVEAARVNVSTVGLSYFDDCFGIGVTYVTNYGYTTTTQPTHAVLVQVSLRTIGATSYSQVLDGPGGLVLPSVFQPLQR
jgi:LPS-assembly protein